MTVMSSPFFFVDRNFQPATLLRDNVRRCSVPMSPPMFEVILSITFDGKMRHFHGTSVRGEDEARRAARRGMQVFLEKNAFVGAEMTSFF